MRAYVYVRECMHIPLKASRVRVWVVGVLLIRTSDILTLLLMVRPCRLAGLHETDDPALRGNYRVVHGGLDPEELADATNPASP